MTTLTITPSFSDKTMQLTGSIAVGEKVSVVIVGLNVEDLEGLRVRLRFANGDVARYPLTDSDVWQQVGETTSGIMELNTVELRKVFEGLDDYARVAGTLVLENNGEFDRLYSVGRISVHNWSAVEGDQVPFELGTWSDRMEELKQLVLSLQESVGLFSGIYDHRHTGEDGTNVLSHSNLSGVGTMSHEQIEQELGTLGSSLSTHSGWFIAHRDNKNNPHSVTAEQLGLGNVDDTSDADKPVSSAVLAMLQDKLEIEDLNAHTDRKDNPHEVTAGQLGLGSVDNTPDLSKPLSTAMLNALSAKVSNLTYNEHIENLDDPHETLVALRTAFSQIPDTPLNTIAQIRARIELIQGILEGI